MMNNYPVGSFQNTTKRLFLFESFIFLCPLTMAVPACSERMCFFSFTPQTITKVFPRVQEYQSYGWWVGEKNGNIGIVPKDYLMELYAL